MLIGTSKIPKLRLEKNLLSICSANFLFCYLIIYLTIYLRKGCGIAIFILIAPDYSNLDWWNRFRWLVVGFSFALGLVKILGEERMLTGIGRVGK